MSPSPGIPRTRLSGVVSSGASLGTVIGGNALGWITDGLVMVLLGGIDTLTGPVVGAALFTWLRDTLARETDFWRAALGLMILLIVVVFPQGLAGGLKSLFARWRPA